MSAEPIGLPTNTRIETVNTACEIDKLARGIVRWLIARQMPSGGIRGDGDTESPSDHYAHSFAALSIALVAETERSASLWERAEKAFDYTTRLPEKQRSIQEFNSLAILMLTCIARSSSFAPAGLRRSLDSLISAPSFLYDGRRQVSNNWLAMRAVCFLIRGQLTTDEQCTQRGEALLRETLGWQLQDGVFIDYPKQSRDVFATPLTYHAKICAMLAISLNYTQQKEVLPALERGLKALVGLMSPQGQCLFYGRSCNSLFGLAAVYYALSVASQRIPGEDWSSATSRISSRLLCLREADGHLRLTPAPHEASRCGWDVYYHSEVYNAYAAALLLYANSPVEETVTNATNLDARNGCYYLPNSGLMAINGSGFFAAFSTKGQCVLDGSSLFSDMRYLGLQPMLIEVDGQTKVPEPPLLWKGAQTKAKAVDPRQIGYLPYIAWKGRYYCTRIFESITVSSGSNWHSICGSGKATSLTLPSRSARLLRRIRGKLTGTGDLAYKSHELPNLLTVRCVVVFPVRRAVIFIDACEGNLPAGAGWFCPNARFLPESGMTARNVVDIRQLAKRATVPTSHGETDLYSCDSPETASPAPGSISAVLCSFGDVDVLVSPNGQQVNISMDEIHLCLNLQTRTIQALP